MSSVCGAEETETRSAGGGGSITHEKAVVCQLVRPSGGGAGDGGRAKRRRRGDHQKRPADGGRDPAVEKTYRACTRGLYFRLACSSLDAATEQRFPTSERAHFCATLRQNQLVFTENGKKQYREKTTLYAARQCRTTVVRVCHPVRFIRSEDLF